MTLFDASVWVGRWPFRPAALTLPALEARLRAHGVEGACVAPVAAVLAPDPLPLSLALCRAAGRRRRGFRWVPAAIIDPSLAGWEGGAAACLRLGARCLKVVPNYHLYPVVAGGTVSGVAPWVPRAADGGLRGLDALCRLAADSGVPVAVQMRLQDERTHHPLMRVPAVPAREVAALAARHPDARFLACACFLGDLAALGAAANVWVELSHVEGRDTLVDALRHVPAGRLLVGSHSPLLYTAAAVAKVESAGAPVEVREAVAHGNADRLWPADGGPGTWH